MLRSDTLVLTSAYSGRLGDWTDSIKAALQGTPGVISWSARAHFVGMGEGDLPWTCIAIAAFDSPRSLRVFFAREGLARLRSEARPVQIIAARARRFGIGTRWKMRLWGGLAPVLRYNAHKTPRPRAHDSAEGFAPTAAQIEMFANWPQRSSIAMVNFVAFRARAVYPSHVLGPARSNLSGEQAYALYTEVALRGICLLGGKLVFSGRVEQIPHDEGPSLVQGPWDTVSIVEYPSGTALLRLGSMPGVAAAHGSHREAALARASSIVTEVDSKPGKHEGPFGAL